MLRSFENESSRKKKIDIVKEEWKTNLHLPYFTPPFNVNTSANSAKPSLRFSNRNGGCIKKMATKVSNFSDLIQRVTASCLLHPLAGNRPDDISIQRSGSDSDSDKDRYEAKGEQHEFQDEEEEGEDEFKEWERSNKEEPSSERIVEMEMLMFEVFDVVSATKRSYVSLQQSHCPWDPDKMRRADVAVVAELRKLGILRERFRRTVAGGGGGMGRWRIGAATIREVVAPYEASLEEMNKELKAKQLEVENLKEKLQTATSFSSNSGKSKGKSKRRVSCTTQIAAGPAPELFEGTMNFVKEASKSFTSLLLSLMRSAHWDIAAAVRSIEAASSNTTSNVTAFTDSIVGTNHSKYALESYVNRKIFQGFDHETFYMDGSLSSLLHPDQHRRDCFTLYRDMKAMDPVELLSILPTCSFGNFCFKKYLAIIHPKMEESLFGDLEQRRQVLEGHHPRSQFYSEFLGLAKAVWLLHLLAFSLEPLPSHFEASRGAEFHSQYMESVTRISSSNGGAKAYASMIVGFPVSPGFKLGNGTVIKARVYLVPKNGY